jgi:hypothetical protein
MTLHIRTYHETECELPGSRPGWYAVASSDEPILIEGPCESEAEALELLRAQLPSMEPSTR